MGRITFEGNFCDISMCRENPCPYNGMCSQRETWERLKKYEDAEQAGRLVVLPCKVGEYWRDWDGERVRIESVSFSFIRRHLCNTDMVTYRYDDKEDDFAVNWIYFKSHFTREEAEAALAQEGGTNEDSGGM